MDSKEEIKQILKNIPLRISITDYCNLNCFFCSNEGMDLNQRNFSNSDFKNVLYLLKTLRKNGLENISITGGDPMCYPKLDALLKQINLLNFKKTFFHTNGVALNSNLIRGELKKFTKVAISIHTLNIEEWKKMTSGNESQFNQLLENLKLLSKENYGNKVEIKIVPIKEFNYSKKSIKEVLNFCNKNNFKFKLLIFEPIKKEHISLIAKIDSIKKILTDIGAKELDKEKSFRNQMDYLPINNYKYKNTEGVLIEIGCGNPEVCKFCSDSNEIFITPNLEIKPCHMSSFTIDLKKAISEKDEEKILNLIVESRNFLSSSPGKNKIFWSQQ